MVTVLDAQILTQRRPAGTCRTLPGDYSHACSYFAREQGGPGWAEGGLSLCRRPLRAARRSRGNLARACEALPGHALGFLLTRFYRLADQARRPAALELSRLPQSTGKGRQHTLSSPDVHICSHFPAGSCHADHPWTSSPLSLLTPRSAPTCPCRLTPEPLKAQLSPAQGPGRRPRVQRVHRTTRPAAAGSHRPLLVICLYKPSRRAKRASTIPGPSRETIFFFQGEVQSEEVSALVQRIMYGAQGKGGDVTGCSQSQKSQLFGL